MSLPQSGTGVIVGVGVLEGVGVIVGVLVFVGVVEIADRQVCYEFRFL